MINSVDSRRSRHFSGTPRDLGSPHCVSRAPRPAMALVDDLPPPPGSFSRGLPIAGIERGTKWWRIHKTNNSPVFFGPAPGGPPTYRFDAPGREYRTLYLGHTLSPAFIETLLRNPL